MAPPRLGLTGGIGSGKSTVMAAFARRGAGVVDTDALAHALTGPGGEAISAIVAQFGPGLIAADGALDRARMRERVFGDPDARERLEAILHPRILRDALARARQCGGQVPLLVFDVPLLAEAHAVRRGLELDRVLVIDCPPERQLAQVLARGGLRRDEAAAIIAAQAPRTARLDLADDIIVNAGTCAELEACVDRLWRGYCPPADPGAGGRAV
jgi:dephospho-CoA kinase